MTDEIAEILKTFAAMIPRDKEFLAAVAGAILGAVVGGLISYFVQVKALREGRRQREEEYKRTQQTLGRALLFKMIRVHSNFTNLHGHVEGSFERAATTGEEVEPWQVVQPLANLPEPIHFAPEEMGMLLGLKNDGVFNAVFEMDVVHNGLIDVMKLYNTDSRALMERRKAVHIDGAVVNTVFNRDEMPELRPRMIELNLLIEQVRATRKKDVEESGAAMDRLNKLLRDKLELAYKLKSKAMPKPAAEAKKPV